MGKPWNLPNYPVVGVTWYEAEAYCFWLTEKLIEARLMPEDCRVMLPSEAEWEKAGRGGVEIPELPITARSCKKMALSPDHVSLKKNSRPERRHPWGDKANPNRANYEATGIGTTSAVGCFPDGASPYGCLDMAGNVWEWTRSLWGKEWDKPNFPYPYNPKDGREDLDAGDEWPRVLRGGAFSSTVRSLRCAFRLRYRPGYGDGFVGFRVALSPF